MGYVEPRDPCDLVCSFDLCARTQRKRRRARGAKTNQVDGEIAIGGRRRFRAAVDLPPRISPSLSARLRLLFFFFSPPQRVRIDQILRNDALTKPKPRALLSKNTPPKTPPIVHRSKTRGLGAGRKLKSHRRSQLWADKDYKKSHLGSEWKKPFAGASHAKGIVLEKM